MIRTKVFLFPDMVPSAGKSANELLYYTNLIPESTAFFSQKGQGHLFRHSVGSTLNKYAGVHQVEAFLSLDS